MTCIWMCIYIYIRVYIRVCVYINRCIGMATAQREAVRQHAAAMQHYSRAASIGQSSRAATLAAETTIWTVSLIGCVTVCNTLLQHTATYHCNKDLDRVLDRVCYSVQHTTATHCNIPLQQRFGPCPWSGVSKRVAGVCCSGLPCSRETTIRTVPSIGCVAVCCSGMLQYVAAVCCSVLQQCIAVYCHVRARQFVARRQR